ncbi:MAG TPA: alanine dehydrogenase [Xanthobacteraceae bacterium]|jgi:alanine dehydrogenase|nr:alanine dehydrogenase [Xanthobacteraceae bacterium]
MLIGVPKEIKTDEYRVGLIPATARELTARGHRVLVQQNAGAGAGIADKAFADAGGEIVAGAEEVFARAELIVKVKEPLAAERSMLRRGQMLFTYLHLAPDRALTEALLASGCTAIAYETVTADNGTLPLLTPMSEVAGRMAPQAGARCLEKEMGGRGMLLGGAPGVPPADVLILGGGVAGSNAALIALGMGAQVTVVDRNPEALRRLVIHFDNRVRTIFSTPEAIETLARRADLIIGTVLIPGAAAPKLLRRETVRAMKPGSAIVDVAIDQGGCAETSRPTTHSQPTYIAEGVVHYCVANMPGAVSRTSTFALNNVTMPFVLALADKGLQRALAEDAHLRAGLNVHAGRLVHPAVAAALGLAHVAAEQALAS